MLWLSALLLAGSPIDVADQKQLFIDRRFMADSDRVELRDDLIGVIIQHVHDRRRVRGLRRRALTGLARGPLIDKILRGSASPLHNLGCSPSTSRAIEKSEDGYFPPGIVT